MTRLFNNPLVIAENIAGSLLDRRRVVLWEQPAIDLEQARAAGDSFQSQLSKIIDQGELKELFTGFGLPYLSDINGWNAYGITYINATVKPSSQLCEHPLESGAVIADYAIINPITATVRIATPSAFYDEIYNQIVNFYVNKRPIILQTKFDFIHNMVISALPHQLDNKDVDRVPIDLELKQIRTVSPVYVSIDKPQISSNTARNPEDVDTKDIGLTNTSESTFDSLKAIQNKGA